MDVAPEAHRQNTQTHKPEPKQWSFWRAFECVGSRGPLLPLLSLDAAFPTSLSLTAVRTLNTFHSIFFFLFFREKGLLCVFYSPLCNLGLLSPSSPRPPAISLCWTTYSSCVGVCVCALSSTLCFPSEYDDECATKIFAKSSVKMSRYVRSTSNVHCKNNQIVKMYFFLFFDFFDKQSILFFLAKNKYIYTTTIFFLPRKRFFINWTDKKQNLSKHFTIIRMTI